MGTWVTLEKRDGWGRGKHREGEVREVDS